MVMENCRYFLYFLVCLLSLWLTNCFLHYIGNIYLKGPLYFICLIFFTSHTFPFQSCCAVQDKNLYVSPARLEIAVLLRAVFVGMSFCT